jgi:hypothetical protein
MIYYRKDEKMAKLFDLAYGIFFFFRFLDINISIVAPKTPVITRIP